RPAPQGYQWNSTDWSCPYDAVFTVLHCMWISDPTRWSHHLSSVSPFSKKLVTLWTEYMSASEHSWIGTRDIVRTMLHEKDPTIFPYG
ncbi:hypothetical protein EV122DRAFT_199849, partial [Schizophyllum commune]